MMLDIDYSEYEQCMTACWCDDFVDGKGLSNDNSVRMHIY